MPALLGTIFKWLQNFFFFFFGQFYYLDMKGEVTREVSQGYGGRGRSDLNSDLNLRPV